MPSESFKPDYIPPHLQGRVSDFRREPDGSVSFFDPRAALGTFGPEESRKTVDANTFNYTFGDGHTDLATAANNQYGLPGSPKTLASGIRSWIVDNGRKGLDYGLSSQGRMTGTAGLLGAIAGGVVGGTGESGSLGKGLLYALLAGGGGAGLVALGQNMNKNREEQRAKIASMTKTAFADTDLLSLLASNHSIPDYEKQRYLAAFSRLQTREKDELARLLRVTAGATAGALIARYLRGKGLLNIVAGGMLGAFVGRAMGPHQTFNRLGQLSVLNLH